MLTQTPTAIYEKLGQIEQEIQRLKVELYFSLPQKSQVSFYPQDEIVEAVRKTRDALWQKRYAKKVKGLL